jgi:hypothetical protein
MLLGTPLEEPFRVIVWLFIGLPLLALLFLIVWPVVSAVLTVQLTMAAMGWAIVLSMIWWVAYWPIALAYRLVTGRSLADVGERPRPGRDR